MTSVYCKEKSDGVFNIETESVDTAESYLVISKKGKSFPCIKDPIGVEYRNCHQTLDVYLRFAIWIGQIQTIMDL